MKALIIWEKWVDPFGDDTNEAKWTDYNNEIDTLDSPAEDEDVDEEEEYPNNNMKFGEKPIKVIASPLGLIPYNEYTASSKIFKFWIGHSNFNITNTIKEIIENTEGVEILDIFTRYRFRIAIGKCFDDAEVMNSINNNVYENIAAKQQST